MPNIFDNIKDESTIGVALRSDLSHFDTLDVATGYLDLRGWASFADLIDQRTATRSNPGTAIVRVLIGMVMPADSAVMIAALQDTVQPPAYGAEVNDMAKARSAKERLVKHLRTQLMHGLPTANQQHTLQQLKAQLQSGAVEMKVFTDAPLHGKAYIFYTPHHPILERRAYVGSSNLTNAGFFKNLELNIDVTDADATKKLADWFAERWGNHFSLPITTEIIELIEESWASEAQPTPYEVYLKVCHALSEDAREGMGYVLPLHTERTTRLPRDRSPHARTPNRAARWLHAGRCRWTRQDAHRRRDGPHVGGRRGLHDARPVPEEP